MAHMKNMYMRKHSTVVRMYRSPRNTNLSTENRVTDLSTIISEGNGTVKSVDNSSLWQIREDPIKIFQSDDPEYNSKHIVAVMCCRMRQRTLQTAWDYLVQKTGVQHDYNEDLQAILSRQIPSDQLRTELEVEVIWKWAYQVPFYSCLIITILNCFKIYEIKGSINGCYRNCVNFVQLLQSRSCI